MDKFLKVLSHVLPAETYREVEIRWRRRQAIRWLRKQGVPDLALKVAEHFDYTVQSGIFRGMRYTRTAVLTHHSTPSLLGTYERQLYPLLRDAAVRCSEIIDIGSAEGYFAIGLARLTGKPVAAFDVNGNERKMLREMAALNQVGHLVKVGAWCDSGRLITFARGKRLLLFCDIDGGEFSLFTPEVVEALEGSDVIIELHGTGEQNSGFFKRWKGRDPIILQHPAEPAGVEHLAFLGSEAKRMATEYRRAQQWLVLRPSSASSLEQLGEALSPPALEKNHEMVNARVETAG